ncbi:MAG TPA: hypothetical protein VE684_19920 [Crenalkalicoccus sp.]|jgi:hypothetical protein|nr:hypothetical protein [Crenalkalicoccus sp.]
MSRAAFAALGLSAAALAGILALELSQITGDQVASTAAAAAVARWRPAPVVPTPTAPDHSREWGATALERPLFAADRRPVAEQRPAVATGGGRDLPRLTGVLVGPTGGTAIFAAAADGARPIVLREGDSLGAFEVKTILVGQVMLVGPEGEQVLRPSFGPRSEGTAARPAALAPARPAAQVTTAGGAGTNDVPGLVPAATPGGISSQSPPNVPPRSPAR